MKKTVTKKNNVKHIGNWNMSHHDVKLARCKQLLREKQKKTISAADTLLLVMDSYLINNDPVWWEATSYGMPIAPLDRTTQVWVKKTGSEAPMVLITLRGELEKPAVNAALADMWGGESVTWFWQSDDNTRPEANTVKAEKIQLPPGLKQWT